MTPFALQSEGMKQELSFAKSLKLTKNKMLNQVLFLEDQWPEECTRTSSWATLGIL